MFVRDGLFRYSLYPLDQRGIYIEANYEGMVREIRERFGDISIRMSWH